MENTEREERLKRLTDEQRHFLLEKLLVQKQILFQRFVAADPRIRVHSVDVSLTDEEKDVSNWHLIKSVDYGKGNLFGECACGRNLRFEFVVQNDVTKKVIRYGRIHLADFLGMNIKNLAYFEEQLQLLDEQLDEILEKTQLTEYTQKVATYQELLSKVEQFYASNETKMRMTTVSFKEIAAVLAKSLPITDAMANLLMKEYGFIEDKDMSVVTQLIIHEEVAIQATNEKASRKELYEQMKGNIRAHGASWDLFSEAGQLANQANNDYSLSDMVFELVRMGINDCSLCTKIIFENGPHKLDRELSISTMDRPRLYAHVLYELFKLTSDGRLKLDEENSSIFNSYFNLPA